LFFIQLAVGIVVFSLSMEYCYCVAAFSCQTLNIAINMGRCMYVDMDSRYDTIRYECATWRMKWSMRLTMIDRYSIWTGKRELKAGDRQNAMKRQLKGLREKEREE